MALSSIVNMKGEFEKVREGEWGRGREQEVVGIIMYCFDDVYQYTVHLLLL